MTNHRSVARVLVGVLVILFALTGFAIAADSSQVNINTASIEELTQLKRVGQKYAEKIVAFREANGPFKSADELVNVPGIGAKTIEANRAIIVVK